MKSTKLIRPQSGLIKNGGLTSRELPEAAEYQPKHDGFKFQSWIFLDADWLECFVEKSSY